MTCCKCGTKITTREAITYKKNKYCSLECAGIAKIVYKPTIKTEAMEEVNNV